MKRTPIKRGPPPKRKTRLKPIGKKVLAEMAERRAFSAAVIKRCKMKDGSGWRCERCKDVFCHWTLIQAHHIKPKSQGGSHDPRKNGAGLCFRCHRLVHDHGSDEFGSWREWLEVRNELGKTA